jgi:hypothetical protein
MSVQHDMPESEPRIGHAAFEPASRPPVVGGLLFVAEVGYVLIERLRCGFRRWAKTPEVPAYKLLVRGRVCTLSCQSSAVCLITVENVRFVAEQSSFP